MLTVYTNTWGYQCKLKGHLESFSSPEHRVRGNTPNHVITAASGATKFTAVQDDKTADCLTPERKRLSVSLADIIWGNNSTPWQSHSFLSDAQFVTIKAAADKNDPPIIDELIRILKEPPEPGYKNWKRPSHSYTWHLLKVCRFCSPLQRFSVRLQENNLWNR